MSKKQSVEEITRALNSYSEAVQRDDIEAARSIYATASASLKKAIDLLNQAAYRRIKRIQNDKIDQRNARNKALAHSRAK